MDAQQMFLLDHARAHSRAVGQAEGGIWISDFTFSGLEDGQMRHRPQEGLNSLAWLLWHMARAEDMGVNLCVAERPQVLESDGWKERLNVARHDMAAGMTDEEVGEFTDAVDIQALRDYRDAVGKRTREVVTAMSPQHFDEQIDAAKIEQAFADGTISQNAEWLRGFMDKKTKAFVLGHVGTGHNFMHLGEAWCLRSMAGLKLPI